VAVAAIAGIGVLLGVLIAIWWLRAAKPAAAVTSKSPASDSEAPTALHVPAATADGEREVLDASPGLQAEAAATDSEPRGSRILVVITDPDRQPVAGAHVEITGDGPPGVHAADDVGICDLPIEPGPGLVKLRITADGYVPSCVHYGRVQRIEVQLFRAAVVKGRVVRAEDDSSVPDARVSLALRFDSCSSQELEVVSDGAGRFEMPGVALDQELEWRVRAEGFASLEIELVQRDPALELELALERGLALEFEVVDAQTGGPIEQATIARDSTNLSTDGSGRAKSSALLSMQETEARVRVHAPGYCTLGAILKRSELLPGSLVKFPLLQGVRLEGWITDSEGAPVPNARVHLGVDTDARYEAGEDEPGPVNDLIDLPEGWTLWGARNDGRHVEAAVSDAAGAFVLEGLEPLDRWYQLLVQDAHRRQLQDWRPVPQLGAPGSITSLRISVARGGSGVISGIMTLNGAPAAGFVGWQGPTQNGSARVEVDGRYRMQGIEAGRIHLRGRPDGLSPSDPCRMLVHLDRTIEMAEGAELELDLPLELELAAIAGRVVDDQGVAQAGVRVAARSADGCWWAQTHTDSAGGFELAVRAGPWPYALTYGAYPVDSRLEGVPAGTRDLELVLSGKGKLRLRVVDSSTRQPLRGFLMQAEDEQGQIRLFHEFLYGQFMPDPEGWHEADLRQGTWRLFIGDPTHEASGYLPLDGGTIQMASTDPVSLELERERGLELEVRLAEGQSPLPEDVTVLLLESSRAGEVQLGPKGWEFGDSWRGVSVLASRQVLPDSKRSSRVVALRPGPHRFVTFPDSIAMEPAEVLVSGEETGAVEIRWTPR
jgi:hypothetical protein